MKKIFLNAIFWKLELLIIILLALDFQIFFTNSAYVCSNKLLNLNCNCKSSINGLVRVECVLLNNNTISSVFNILSGSTEKIDKISILKCEKKNELLKSLPKLQCRSLQISNCGIKQVSEKSFDNLSDTLEELILSHNNISTFPYLKSLNKLKVVNLNNNTLRDIPEHSFDGLDQIKQIRLKNNNICLLLPNALSETKTTLEFLDLSYNCFTSVPAQNLRNAINLEYLSLKNNQISDLTQMEFMNLIKLIELRLDNNRLTRIPPNAFINVPMLAHLFVRNNQIKMFESAHLHMFKQIKIIDLGENILQKIPQFKDHLNLTEVHLDNNRIKKIDTLTFSGNSNLMTINLRNNRISVISRNSFDTLDKLNYLFLSNNNFTTLERYMFDGMKSLRYLALSNNSISQINPAAFSSIPNIYILDLSNNRIKRINAGTFKQLPKLEFLILSNNTNLTFFDEGSFSTRISTILLDGIDLNCDERFDWFVSYLVQNNVRTFLPNQKEILCSSSSKYAGKRLKDLMMSRANETHFTSINNFNLGKDILANNNQQNKNLLLRLIPSFTGSSSGRGIGSIPLLNSITQAMPSLREIPGLNVLTQKNVNLGNKKLDSAIEQFTEPLVNFASSSQLIPSDINQLIKSIPNLVVNIPNFGNIDISKLPPGIIQKVLSGGDIPGIPRETLDKIVKEYMERLYIAAAKAQNLNPTGVETSFQNIDSSKYLIPVSELPSSLVTNAMNGGVLPHLDKEQTQTILDYYTQQIPTIDNLNITSFLSPKTLQMLKLLPKGFNMSELPPDFIKTAMRGEMPDLSLMPPSLLQHFKNNLDNILNQFSANGMPQITIEEVLKKLPKFDHVEASTFSPYDINNVDSDLVISERNFLSETNNAKIYTALGLGLAAAITLIILLFFCYKMSQQNRAHQDVTKNKSGLNYNNSISKISNFEDNYNHQEVTTRHLF